MKTISNVISCINTIAHRLSSTYDDPMLCEQYAWWIVEAITGLSKTKLLAQWTFNLTPSEQTKLAEWLDALTTHNMPIAYLIGSVPFFNVDILVEPPILIPRPETEEWCINLITTLQKLSPKKLTILDLCCGSGCIAIALAKALPHAMVYAMDISPAAVALTKKNSLHNNVTNIICLQSDLFTACPAGVTFDLIVSNPPYIDPAAWDNLDASVTQWEDPAALVTSDNGLAIIKKIIAQAPHYLKNNDELARRNSAQLIIEIGFDQGTSVKELMEARGYSNVHILQDLSGKNRVVTGRYTDVATTKTTQ